jgi:hypothetical protein
MTIREAMKSLRPFLWDNGTNWGHIYYPISSTKAHVVTIHNDTYLGLLCVEDYNKQRVDLDQRELMYLDEASPPAEHLGEWFVRSINLNGLTCTCDFRGANVWLGCRCGAFKSGA